MAQEFTETERLILHRVQADLPETLTPFADVAAEVGTTEEEVLSLLTRLRDSGTIRRFGVSLMHNQAGWSSNCMVGWIVDRATADVVGPLAAEHPNVSHCYFRATQAEDWPYQLYTMVHGRSTEECERVIAELKDRMKLSQYLVLKTVREIKKISPTYF